MGFRDRIKAKLKEKVQDMRAFVRVVNEEAKHPGRPQPHMVARNPLWGGEAGPDPTKSSVPEQNTNATVNAQPPQKSSPSNTAQRTADPVDKKQETEEEEFWYLRGDDEGWSDLNPGNS
jgi:hypothetical protein